MSERLAGGSPAATGPGKQSLARGGAGGVADPASTGNIDDNEVPAVDSQPAGSATTEVPGAEPLPPATAARETTLLVLNGPNLGRLGSREPEVYGHATLADLRRACQERAAQLGWVAEVRQTDDEAELIGWLHEAADLRLPVVLNPAAFTHYSYALRDAAAQRTAALVEVHLSNPHAREEFRHNSVISGVASAVIAGAGLGSYLLAIDAIASGHVS